MVETLQGEGQLRSGDPFSTDYIAVDYHIEIVTTLRNVRPGFPPVSQSKATVHIVRPVDPNVVLPEGYYSLTTHDGETLRIKNLGITWALLS